MIEEVLGGLINASSGGIFGGIMALAGGFMKGREKSKQHGRDMDLAKLQIEADNKTHIRNMEASRENASANAFLASIKDDQSSNAPGWASGIKAIFRPFLTTMLLFIAAYIFYTLSGALRGDASVISGIFTADEISTMLRDTVRMLQFSASASISWWFGERCMMSPRSK